MQQKEKDGTHERDEEQGHNLTIKYNTVIMRGTLTDDDAMISY